MQTLSLCIIVKDEERYIENCLNSVASIIDEIIIVDTGSSDRTIELAERFNPKHYSCHWQDNFSHARNCSLEHATCDWILVLDADEAVHPDDLHTLKNIIQTTQANGLSLLFHNYINEKDEENFIMHTGLRLFKNHTFRYEGAIHEQLVATDQAVNFNIETTNIRILHYGYIKSNTDPKNKRERNIPIIQKLLDQNANDAFQLFNMGNEFMCQEDYAAALSYFEKSYAHKDITQAYCPHLLYRRAACLHYLNRNEESLQAVLEGLMHYPACTDFEYLRGIIYKLTKRYTLAIDSFNQCLSMGAAPRSLTFFSDVGTFRPLVELGSIYYLLDDWPKSLDHYIKSLQCNGKRYDIIYKVGNILNKMLSDKNEVGKNLEKLFADSFYITNVLVVIDVLINEGLYDEAGIYFERIENVQHYIDDKNYLQGRLNFYSQKFDAAYQFFLTVINNSAKQSILMSVLTKSYEYLSLCCLINKKPQECEALVQQLADSQEKQILLYFIKERPCTFPKSAIPTIFSILSEILRVHKFELFEQKLPILNLIDSNTVLLELADIYYNNGYKEMAMKSIINSVKEFGLINARAVYVLNKEFLL